MDSLDFSSESAGGVLPVRSAALPVDGHIAAAEKERHLLTDLSRDFSFLSLGLLDTAVCRTSDPFVDYARLRNLPDDFRPAAFDCQFCLFPGLPDREILGERVPLSRRLYLVPQDLMPELLKWLSALVFVVRANNLYVRCRFNQLQLIDLQRLAGMSVVDAPPMVSVWSAATATNIGTDFFVGYQGRAVRVRQPALPGVLAEARSVLAAPPSPLDYGEPSELSQEAPQ